MPSCDVTIIGAGFSGLTAAALLSRAGLSVCVVEEQPNPGGYLQGFGRRGFVFDTAVQWLNGLGPDGMLGRLLGHLGQDLPACRPLQNILRYRGESFDYLLSREPDRLCQQLCEDFPTEADGLRLLFEHCRQLGRALRVLYGRMRAPETMGLLTKIWLGLRMLAWYLPVRRFIRAPMMAGLARYVADPGRLALFAPEEKLIEVMTPIAWSYEGDYYAPPAGGCQSWVRWLTGLLDRAGAELRLGEPAQQVLLAGGRAVGVRCASGHEVRSRWVIAACDVERLYEQMLPEGTVPAGLLGRLKGADIYYSNLTLFLGLSCDPAALGMGEEMVRLTLDDATTAEHNSGDPDRAALTLLAPSVRDPSLAPPGKGTLTVHCQAWLDRHQRWQTGPGLQRGEAYRRLKEQQAEKVLRRLERQLVPGLRDHLELMEVATPVTYLRYTGNRGGSIMGASPTDRNIRARLAHYRTPVPGLLLAGHWAEYGGGVPMAVKAAANCSLMILQRDAPGPYRELCEVVDGR